MIIIIIIKTWEDRALCTPEFRFHITHFNQVSKLGPQQHAFPIYTRKEKKTKTLSNLAESWQQGLKPIEVTDKLGATFFRCSYFKVSLESRLERNESLRFNFVKFTLNTLRILITRTSLRTLPTRPTTIVSFTLKLFSGLAQILYRVSPPKKSN